MTSAPMNSLQTSTPTTLTAQQQQHVIQLLQACIKCVHSGVFHPVVYQAMGALHQYSMMHHLPRDDTSTISKAIQGGASKPAFFLVKNDNKKIDSSEDKKEESEDGGAEDEDDDDEDVLCYGWMQQLSNIKEQDDESRRPIDDFPRWNSVLALLVQKDKSDEPCLWITREVMASSTASSKDLPGSNKQKKWKPPTELETLHQIPILRRLQSCRYHNFYGDHRIVLRLRHKRADIVLKCPTAQDAQQWVQQIQWWKKQHSMGNDNNIELEMVDTLDSQDTSSSSGRLKHHVNIVNEQMQFGASTTSLPESPEKGIQKRLAEQLQQAEDIKRAQKEAEREAQELLEKERELQQQEEQIKHETALRTDLTRVEREQEARRRGEEARRKKELEYEQEKLEREKRRREELEVQRKLAREEQRKKDEERKKKFLEHEAKKERLKADAAAEAAARNAKIPKSTSIKPTSPAAAVKPPVKAAAVATVKPPAVAARSASDNPKGKGVSNTPTNARSSPKTAKQSGNEGLWFSLDQQMSAFEAADAERRKAEEAKRKEEEEKRKIKLGLDEVNETPEEARRRIAEQARQRLVQEEAGRRKVDIPVAVATKQDEAKRAVSPVSPVSQQHYMQQQPASHQRSHSSQAPMQHQQQRYQYPPQHNQQGHQSASHAQWQSQEQQQQQQQHNVQRQQRSQHPAHPNTPRTANQSPQYNAQQPQYSQQQRQRQQQQQYHQAQNYPSQPATASPAYQHRQAPQPHHNQSSPHHGNPSQPPHHQPHYGQSQQPQQQMPSHEQPMDSSEKYAAMANQSDDGHAATTRIKHAILVQWALLPPQLHILRPIDVLLTTVHQVFPPALGVAGHEYFSKWKPVTQADVANEEKLKKAVRKLRFFLHPDKLPRDLSGEQQFTCKLLWDVTNDAFEDYKKGKEDLDWV